MNKYNRNEKYLAVLLSNSPLIKNIIKKVYQYINFLLNKKKYRLKSKFKISEVDNSNLSSFFGYYDKSPENFSGTKVIYYRSHVNTTNKPSENDSIQIILKCLKTNTTKVIDKTVAYNWQQGAKMMWMTDVKFIYNVFSKQTNSYHSKIYDINNKTFKSLEFPVYECFKDVSIYSLNFSRLMDIRPDYGYRNFTTIIDYDSYQNDGIFKLNINDNSYSLIISLKQLIDLKPLSNMNNAKHWVNHIMVSPNGENLMFMHRWISKSGKRFDRLVLTDSEGVSFCILADNEMVSHCCWNGNDSIVGYFRHNDEDGFYQISILNYTIESFAKGLTGFGDGHPTIVSNKMIFDTYPDRSRMKQLYIYDLSQKKLQFLAEFYESFQFYNETRCDLHPRFNCDQSAIYVDSVHQDIRKLYKIDLK